MAALAVVAMMIPVGGKADTPGRHPRYLRARSDLRAVQWLSRVHEEPNVMRNLKRCDEEIEAAIHLDRRFALTRHKLAILKIQRGGSAGERRRARRPILPLMGHNDPDLG